MKIVPRSRRHQPSAPTLSVPLASPTLDRAPRHLMIIPSLSQVDLTSSPLLASNQSTSSAQPLVRPVSSISSPLSTTTTRTSPSEAEGPVSIWSGRTQDAATAKRAPSRPSIPSSFSPRPRLLCLHPSRRVGQQQPRYTANHTSLAPVMHVVNVVLAVYHSAHHDRGVHYAKSRCGTVSRDGTGLSSHERGRFTDPSRMEQGHGSHLWSREHKCEAQCALDPSIQHIEDGVLELAARTTLFAHFFSPPTSWPSAYATPCSINPHRLATCYPGSSWFLMTSLTLPMQPTHTPLTALIEI